MAGDEPIPCSGGGRGRLGHALDAVVIGHARSSTPAAAALATTVGGRQLTVGLDGVALEVEAGMGGGGQVAGA